MHAFKRQQTAHNWPDKSVRLPLQLHILTVLSPGSSAANDSLPAAHCALLQGPDYITLKQGVPAAALDGHAPQNEQAEDLQRRQTQHLNSAPLRTLQRGCSNSA